MTIAIIVYENRKTKEKSVIKFQCVDLDHAKFLAKKIRSRGTKIVSVNISISVDLRESEL